MSTLWYALLEIDAFLGSNLTEIDFQVHLKNLKSEKLGFWAKLPQPHSRNTLELIMLKRRKESGTYLATDSNHLSLSSIYSSDVHCQ